MKSSTVLLILAAAFWCSGQPARADEPQISGANCNFVANPDDFLSRQSRVRSEIWERAANLNQRFGVTSSDVAAAQSIPQRNFIDTAIFSKLAQANVPSAKLSGDEEFLRRVSLDLTGRVPSSEDIRAFLADASADKRDAMIEKLLNNRAYVDKWTMWLGDLLQNTSVATNVNRNIGGRDAFNQYLKVAIANDKSFRDIAWETVSAGGNTYDGAAGQTNFVFGATTPMGPIQDTYDTMLGKTATAFLGLAY
ncbi:MAG: DUF1549 domain-containing protein, partial [Acidobacteriota bacterium]|nr:DUF1549 domain-containing protein [Acidobacteriota bacterium]